MRDCQSGRRLAAPRGARLDLQVRRRPLLRRPLRRHRACRGRIAGERQEILDQRGECRALRHAGRQHDQREDQPVARRDRREPAGEAGKVRAAGFRRGRLDRMAARLHLGLREGQPAAAEHRIGDVRRRGEAGHAHVEPRRADRRDRQAGDPQPEAEHVARPAGHGRHCIARKILPFGRQGEAGAVAAEDEGEVAAVEPVGESGDHRRRDRVHLLVAARRDRIRRALDIGDADEPAVRHRPIGGVIGDAREVGEEVKAVVEAETVLASRLRAAQPFRQKTFACDRVHRRPPATIDRVCGIVSCLKIRFGGGLRKMAHGGLKRARNGSRGREMDVRCRRRGRTGAFGRPQSHMRVRRADSRASASASTQELRLPGFPLGLRVPHGR